MFKLAGYLKRTRPAVLMSCISYANSICSMSCLLAGRPCRLVLRESNFLYARKRPWSGKIRSYIGNILKRVFYRYADALVVNAQDTLHSLREANIILPKSTHIIGNPVPINSTYNECNELLDDKLLTNKLFICAIGRLAEQKGFDILISALAKSKYSELHLVLLGEGELYSALQMQAQELGVEGRLHFFGFVEDTSQIFKKAAAFVLSSRWEGFPNVLAEALACGVPVVATNCPGGARTILEDGKYGLLVPPEDSDALAKAIDQTLQEPISTPELRRARAQEFSCEKITKMYLEKVLIPSNERDV